MIWTISITPNRRPHRRFRGSETHSSATANRFARVDGLRFGTKKKFVLRSGRMWVPFKRMIWNTFLVRNVPGRIVMETRDWMFHLPFATIWAWAILIFVIGGLWI